MRRATLGTMIGVAAFRIALLSVVMSGPAPGCATISSALPKVIAVVTDGLMVIDTIETFVHKFFANHPAADVESKIDKAIARARGALNVALRTAHGAEKLDQAQIDAAFEEFRKAYQELLALVGPLGVRSGDKLAAAPGGIIVPEPLALRRR